MDKFKLRIIDDLGFEVWADIPGYEGQYQVSTYGRVRSLDHYGSNGVSMILYKGKILKPCMGSEGYPHIYLSGGPQRSFMIHRLVAGTFIPNFDNKREVNHRDENKLNNLVSNLEWLSSKENANYGTRNSRVVKARKESGFIKGVSMLNLDGNLVRDFESLSDAAKYVNGNRSNICACCNNRKEKAYGYRWRYI